MGKEYVYVAYRPTQQGWEMLGIYDDQNIQSSFNRCTNKGDTVVKLELNVAYPENSLPFPDKNIIFKKENH